MDDSCDAVASDSVSHQRPVTGAAGNEGNRGWYQKAEAAREIVEHDHGLTCVHELVHHVTPDITRASRNQNRHVERPLLPYSICSMIVKVES